MVSGLHDYADFNIQERRVRWKIDLVILPIFLVTQCLQFMDKTALNYANLFGYQKALNLKGSGRMNEYIQNMTPIFNSYS
jgi:hypothetical protein